MSPLAGEAECPALNVLPIRRVTLKLLMLMNRPICPTDHLGRSGVESISTLVRRFLGATEYPAEPNHADIDRPRGCGCRCPQPRLAQKDRSLRNCQCNLKPRCHSSGCGQNTHANGARAESACTEPPTAVSSCVSKKLLFFRRVHAHVFLLPQGLPCPSCSGRCHDVQRCFRHPEVLSTRHSISSRWFTLVLSVLHADSFAGQHGLCSNILLPAT